MNDNISITVNAEGVQVTFEDVPVGEFRETLMQIRDTKSKPGIVVTARAEGPLDREVWEIFVDSMKKIYNVTIEDHWFDSIEEVSK